MSCMRQNQLSLRLFVDMKRKRKSNLEKRMDHYIKRNNICLKSSDHKHHEQDMGHNPSNVVYCAYCDKRMS